ncbi:MAG: butyrate kinase [Clostridiales bacterium]|nr:butyrate kinase [Candidatus Crickella merdequi]
MKILIINPGGTSTKIAVYEDEQEVFKASIDHTAEELKPYPHVFDEFEYRKNLILNTVKDAGFDISEFGCVAGRGGLCKSVEGGTYAVNDALIEDFRNAINGEHASNLGAVIGKSIGDELGVPAFIVDPVATDEMMDIARITGLKELERPAWFHALNHKAVARSIADKIGKKYEDCNFIVAHLGSGISIVAHKNGMMVDGSGGRTNGPFSPERCGSLPTYPLVNLCYSGKYTKQEMVDKISKFAGMYDFLGTKDSREVEQRIADGDEEAKMVYDAFVYNTAKEICSYIPAFDGPVDRIIVTGGIAHSKYVTEEIARMTQHVAPTEVVAGEYEMVALALGALRVMRGEEEAKEYK